MMDCSLELGGKQTLLSLAVCVKVFLSQQQKRKPRQMCLLRYTQVNPWTCQLENHLGLAVTEANANQLLMITTD